MNVSPNALECEIARINGMISMLFTSVLLGLGIGALALGGALAGAVVGHPCGPYVYRPRYSPSFNPYYCPPYSHPMMWMGTGMGMSPGFYPWSPMPWAQPSIFGYW